MLRNIAIILTSLFFTLSVWAQEIALVGKIEQTLVLTAREATSNVKWITLLQYKLSESAAHSVYQQAQRTLNHPTILAANNTALPKKVQLEMNNVPVLDQGQHGTCVTFAVTAAIDAALKKGNYISQLCLLQLGQYLENQGLGESGWDGSTGTHALKRIDAYGIINFKNQQQYGCGGLKNYPYADRPNGQMSVAEYQQRREDLKPTVKWQLLFSRNPLQTNQQQMDKMVTDVKTALQTGHRVAFAVLLPRTDLGTMGAVGWHRYFSDTWVLTQPIADALQHAQDLPGHEMIITGYDDQAVAMDNYGHRHHGLFKLRNSWGKQVADSGDFYMSYDYFKTLAIDAHQIGLVNNNG